MQEWMFKTEHNQKPELRKIGTIKTQVRREFFIDVTKVVFRNKRSTSPF